eukprot:8927227-Prorocentrum_lima.AAC.1
MPCILVCHETAPVCALSAWTRTAALASTNPPPPPLEKLLRGSRPMVGSEKDLAEERKSAWSSVG